MAERILDSWAILAYFEQEKCWSKVESILASAVDRNRNLYISVINLGEVWYNIARRLNPARADKLVNEFLGWPIEVVDIDWSLSYIAANYKANFSIALADCYAAALTKAKEGELVTGDPDFKRLESEINIHWLS